MSRQAGTHWSGPTQTGAAVALALMIFTLDILSPLQGALAVLYTTVVLIVARGANQRAVTMAGGSCAMLALAGYAISHGTEPLGSPAMRLAVSLLAIGITTLLSARHRGARDMLAEQARTLELSHDTVVIRDRDDVILYWNEGAEQLYGWSRKEALGRKSQMLLATTIDETAPSHLAATGRWAGEIVRLRKDGERIVLASRWLVRRDTHGADTGVIETSADLTPLRRSASERQRSEERYRSIFNAAGLPIWESDMSAAIAVFDGGKRPDATTINVAATKAVVRDANHAAAALFGLPGREALIGQTLLPFHTADADATLTRILIALAAGEKAIEEETRFKSASGEIIDVTLHVTLPPNGGEWTRVLIMAVDVTARNRAEAHLAQAQAELAHVSRLTTLGQMAASIAHEVNQPLTAIVNYARSGKRWLAREAPSEALGEVADCLANIASNGTRAADVIARIRDLARRADPKQSLIDIATLVAETLAFVRRDMDAGHVAMITQLAPDLPLVLGDRVQLQQVLINLLLNAEQAMRDTPPDRRELCLDGTVDCGHVVLTVRDCGTGFQGPAESLFVPFFTTREDGMGMGLSICRAIVEKHGGSLSAQNHPAGGASFTVRVPTAPVQKGTQE